MPISTQAVGAYGEKAVEAELLRRGWLPANINDSIKNAANFDIIAIKGEHRVPIRVKTSGPGTHAFQFGFRSPGKILPPDLSDFDITVLVDMGDTRIEDGFYLMRTRPLREQIAQYRAAYLAQERKGGGPRKDLGMWTLHLAGLADEKSNLSYSLSHGFFQKWTIYRDKWDLLDEIHKP